jgi:hypothetical protein
MAGIPLHRVHELEYAPGEVRLDVNYNTVRASLPITPALSYQQVVQRGTLQLQTLRATPSKDLINVKDQVYNQEVKTLVAQDEQWKQEKRQRQEDAEQERNERYGNQWAAVQQQTSSGSNDSWAAPAAGVSVLAMAAGAAAVSKNGNRETDAPTQPLQEQETVGAANFATTHYSATGSTDAIQSSHLVSSSSSSSSITDPNVAATSASTESDKYRELQALEELIDTAPIAIPEFGSGGGGGGSTTFRGERTTPGLYGSNTGRTVAPLTTTTATEEDRVQIAAQAMQDYMDQDDGGDAFLGMLEELLNEQVVDEDDDQEEGEDFALKVNP